MIEGSTRKNNLLDLFFCSDLDTIVSHEVIENVLFSDHAICVINTLIATEPQKHKKKDKLYTTDIPEYDLMKAEETNWNDLNSDISSLFVNWDNILNENTIENSANILIANIETAVKNTMKSLDNSKPKGSSNNIIPKDIRKLF